MKFAKILCFRYTKLDRRDEQQNNCQADTENVNDRQNKCKTLSVLTHVSLIIISVALIIAVVLGITHVISLQKQLSEFEDNFRTGENETFSNNFFLLIDKDNWPRSLSNLLHNETDK